MKLDLTSFSGDMPPKIIDASCALIFCVQQFVFSDMINIQYPPYPPPPLGGGDGGGVGLGAGDGDGAGLGDGAGAGAGDGDGEGGTQVDGCVIEGSTVTVSVSVVGVVGGLMV